MSFTIATWNVNSIRSRLHALLPWLEKVGPDVVCLQETKVQDHEFPLSAIEEAGTASFPEPARLRSVAARTRLMARTASTG